MKQGRWSALLPILVFLVLYLGMGILFEYIMGISMGFYNIPIVVVFVIALMVALLQNRETKLDTKMAIMGRGVGDRIMMTMILIFLLAGIFVGVLGRSSAESVAFLFLDIIPPQFAVAVLFLVACLISISMGTSCGTITVLTPIAVSISLASGFSLPLCVGAVMGGAMFGDNLSFISDTTIAACQGQGCEMKDKFRENFKIALPAALVTLVLIIIVSLNAGITDVQIGEYNLIQTLPYLLVLVLGIVGVNVFIVLITGIVTGAIVVLATGAVDFMGLLGGMGSGASGMFETTMVAILVAAICALVREYGGFEALLAWIKRTFKSRKGGQLGMGLLVGLLDISTANNTVAIIMANPIAADMAKDYGISRRKTASLLDTFSCVFQGIIPYGAQMLIALGACATLGATVSAFDVIPFLWYPFALLVSSLVFIFFVPPKTDEARAAAEAAGETAGEPAETE